MTKPKPRPDAASAAPAVHVPNKGKFVTVASKLPWPLELRLQKPVKQTVVGRHGNSEETVYRFHGVGYVIRGNAYPNGNQLPKGFPRRPEMIEDECGGYALTKQIPADFWAAWVEQNAETEMVRNGMIMAQTDVDGLAAEALDFAKRDSGLAPLNPEMDGKGKPLDRRSPRPVNFGVSDVEQADRAAV
jgi:hypothetical protein